MARQHYHLTTLTFDGESFAGHGLELDVLADLATYKQLVVETAKALWKARHLDRERLPRGFEDGIRLKFYGVQPGSVAVPIEREVVLDETGGKQELFEKDFAVVDDAAALIEEAVDAVSQGGVLPEQFPKNVIRLFDGFGKSLRHGDSIRMQCAHRTRAAVYKPETRERFVNWTDSFYEDAVSVTGEVRQADLDGCKFTLCLDDESKPIGIFDPRQEEAVTEALREHASRRLRVNGIGRFWSATGRLDRFIRVDSLRVEEQGNHGFDASVTPVWREIVEIGASIPEEEWAKLPTDLAENLGHYLNGKE